MDTNNSQETKKAAWPRRVWRFYVDGFRQMTIGKKLWCLIIFKLIFIFIVLKLFFFPNILQRDYNNDSERAEAVRMNMTK